MNNIFTIVVCSCCRHTVFVQEYEVLSPREELLLVLRGGPADLEVGWCRWEDKLTSREVGVDRRIG